MDPAKRALEETMLQSFIEASLKEVDEDIMETYPGVDHVYPRPVFEVNEQIIIVAQSVAMDEDRLGTWRKHMELQSLCLKD